MSKRKISQKQSSKHLNLYTKSYKGGGKKDVHLNVFQDARRLTGGAALPDELARDNVESNKRYEQDAQYRFYCYNVSNKMPKVDSDYDLLISLSAGAIAEPCSSYFSEGGYLLVNDSHSDARIAFVSADWQLMAYWDDEKSAFTTDNLDRCFQVIQKGSEETASLSKKQAQESAAIGTKSKRSFKLLVEPMFFLFQKKLRFDQDRAKDTAR